MRNAITLHSRLLLASVAYVGAWNTDVHNQIGLMAETFLTPSTTSILSQILEPQYNGSIGRAAAWADAYAHTAQGRFSYQWHWITTHDSAPSTCGLNYTNDCTTGGCVVSAIANQTQILRGCIKDVKKGDLQKGGASNQTCAQALKWVAHFSGDIAQPLHASGKLVGGNRFNVSFAGAKTQLHAVWDGYIPYLAANVSHPFSNSTLAPFFAGLLERIHKDEFFEAPYLWLACSDPSTAADCAARWATETNKWNCDYVYKNLEQGEDVAANGYAKGGVPIVELQISKAALRLGTWLNKLVESTGLDSPSQEQEIVWEKTEM